MSGMFDYNWRFSDSLAQVGDPEIRAKGRQLHRPKPNTVVSREVLESCVGQYQVGHGPLIEVFRDGRRLRAKQQGQSEVIELVPESEMDYIIPAIGIRISFVRDSSGKVTGFTGYQNGDFEAKKLEKQ